MSDFTPSRRRLMLGAGTLGLGAVGLALSGCGGDHDADVTANEDLMREHGVIRRALFIYTEAAHRARQQPATIPIAALLDTAKLFREFAEDYHEHALEEAHIFPVVRKLKTPVAALPDVLQAQHQRGREITDYLLKITAGSAVPFGESLRFANALDSLVAMYGPHAAREDTVLFPAWKAALGPRHYADMGEQFEDIEHQTFGHDGFNDAVARIAKAEEAFGLSDLAKVTAPAAPQLS